MKVTQTTAFLNGLVLDVQNGLLLPAAFQRPYVWGKPEVLALVESLLREYPLGGMLLWSPEDKSSFKQYQRSRLGPCQASEPQAHASLLLDGQNRLATLAWLTRDPATPLPEDLTEQERITWADGQELVADLAAKVVRYVAAEDVDKGFFLPVNALFDSRIANRIIRIRWSTTWAGIAEAEREDGLRWLDKASYAVSNAKVIETNLSRASLQEAKHAFMHICKVGVPMSEEDFEAALAWAS